MGAQRTGLWRLHCSVFSLKQSATATPAAGGGASPLFLLKSEGHTFALHNQHLLQGGPELQHILLQATTAKGTPPLKPRLTGSIDGNRFRLGDFVFFVGQARVSERLKGDVFAIEYCPCLQWVGNYAAALKQPTRKIEQTADRKPQRDKQDPSQHPAKRPKLNSAAAGAKGSASSKGTTQQPAKKSGPTTAEMPVATQRKAESQSQKARSQPLDSSAVTAGNNAARNEGKHDALLTSVSTSCDRIMDEIVAAACATTAAAARTTIVGAGGGIDERAPSLANVLMRSRVPLDAAEFQAVGLDERQWSERHSALMFLSLFRGLS